MTTIFILFGSILLGFLMRKTTVPSAPTWVVTIIVWTLLFLMGISIGSNNEIISNIASYGKQALALGILATVGSASAAWIISKKSIKE